MTVPNEVLFFVTVAVDLTFIAFMTRFCRMGLISVIVVNTILITTLGAKLIPLFGFVTNTGNVFYAMVFAGGVILAEHYGRKQAYWSVWIGFMGIAVFTTLWQFTNQFASIPQTAHVDSAMKTLFTQVPRLALASMAAYLLSQHLNIFLYDYLRKKFNAPIWKKTILSAMAGQALDSVIFFSIAFVGALMPGALFQTMYTGFILKVFIAILSVPFVHWSYRFVRKTEELALEE